MPSCAGKTRYKRHQQAESQAAKILKTGNFDGPRVPLYTYRCKSCAGWHLTRKPQKAEQVGRKVRLPRRAMA